MHRAGGLLVGVLGLVGAACAQTVPGDGLSPPQAQAQGRVRLGMSVAATPFDATGSGASHVSGASLLGDYYFGRLELRDGDAAGFRATSGVLVGSRLGMWGGTGGSGLGSTALSVEAVRFSLAHTGTAQPDDAIDDGAVPYFGFGYSGVSIKGGWGFSADLGMLALNPSSVTRLGRSLGAGQNLDDALREIRLSPLLQIGASYSF